MKYRVLSENSPYDGAQLSSSRKDSLIATALNGLKKSNCGFGYAWSGDTIIVVQEESDGTVEVIEATVQSTKIVSGE